MRLYDVNKRLRNKSVTKYSIDWDKKSRSKIQFKVKQFLKTYWKAHVVFEEFPVYGTKLKVDILNATIKVAVEVQGRQHSSFNKFFHDNSRAKYLASIKRDFQKSQWLEMNNYKLIEVEESEIDLISKQFFEENFQIKL